MSGKNSLCATIFLLLTVFLAGCAAEKNVQKLDIPRSSLNVRIDTDSLSAQAMKSIEFSASVSGGDGDYSYIWDFVAADGYTVDGFHPHEQYIYPEQGQYTISLHAADASGALGKTEIKIDVVAKEYNLHAPIKLRDLSAPADKPYVIENYVISNPEGDGISLIRCENVIIRNCYIHDCRKSRDEEGYAIYAEYCHNVTIQNVYVRGNRSGIVIQGNPDDLSRNFLVENSVIADCNSHDSLSFTNAEKVEVRFNELYDNGTIWDSRISGISFNGTFRDISINNNLVINSDSDGIECLGNDEQEIAANVEIKDNILRNSGEQGVWLYRVKDSHIHHNYIEGSHNNGICLDGWVSNTIADANVIVRCGGILEMKHHGGGAVAVHYSCDNIIQDNILVDSSCADVTIGFSRGPDEKTKGMDSKFLETSGNVVDSNVMCSSESNISIGEGVSATSITNNVAYQQGNGRHYHGVRPEKSNIKAKPLFRNPEIGDFWLLSESPGYKGSTGS